MSIMLTLCCSKRGESGRLQVKNNKKKLVTGETDVPIKTATELQSSRRYKYAIRKKLP